MPKGLGRCHYKVRTIWHGPSNGQAEFACPAVVAEGRKNLRLQFILKMRYCLGGCGELHLVFVGKFTPMQFQHTPFPFIYL
jgi:hypothetical protein